MYSRGSPHREIFIRKKKKGGALALATVDFVIHQATMKKNYLINLGI